MFHGCVIRIVPTLLFFVTFATITIILLCSIIITVIKNKNNHLSFKKIIKKSFSDLLDEGLDIGLYFLAECFVFMVIAVPISCSKKHAIKEAEHYCERCITLSKEINKANKNKENIPEELKYYDIILLNKKMEMYEEARKNLDYWNNIINK